jgi:hypothetical protein
LPANLFANLIHIKVTNGTAVAKCDKLPQSLVLRRRTKVEWLTSNDSKYQPEWERQT